MTTRDFIKTLVKTFQIEALTYYNGVGTQGFRLRTDNRSLRVILDTRYGQVYPKLRLYLCIYDVAAILAPEAAKSRKKLEEYPTLCEDIDFPSIAIKDKTEDKLTEDFLQQVKSEFQTKVIDKFFNKYIDGAAVGNVFTGPYTYREVSDHRLGFSIFMGPFFEQYLICKSLAGIPGFLEELEEYEEMFKSIPEGWEMYPGQGKFKGYNTSIVAGGKPIIERLRATYLNTISKK